MTLIRNFTSFAVSAYFLKALFFGIRINLYFKKKGFPRICCDILRYWLNSFICGTNFLGFYSCPKTMTLCLNGFTWSCFSMGLNRWAFGKLHEKRRWMASCIGEISLIRNILCWFIQMTRHSWPGASCVPRYPVPFKFILIRSPIIIHIVLICLL